MCCCSEGCPQNLLYYGHQKTNILANLSGIMFSLKCFSFSFISEIFIILSLFSVFVFFLVNCWPILEIPQKKNPNPFSSFLLFNLFSQIIKIIFIYFSLLLLCIESWIFGKKDVLTIPIELFWWNLKCPGRQWPEKQPFKPLKNKASNPLAKNSKISYRICISLEERMFPFHFWHCKNKNYSNSTQFF